MYNIKTLNKIAKCGLDELPGDKFLVSEAEGNPDGVLVRSFVMDDSTLTPNLKCIGRAGAGVNNIPVDECAKRGIVVFNTPGANANAVKELVVAGLMLCSRNIHAGINWVQSLQGQEGVAATVEKGKADFAGPEITGKTLGVIGLGAIGGIVANAANALGMKVVGYDPFLSEELAAKLSPDVQKVDSEDAVAAASEYLTIHAPMTAKTKHKFNAEFFAKCKKGVKILNFSRAELVDNVALLAAIADGTVSCYVTDFPTEDLLGNDKIITIPHLGASTPESEDNCATMAAAQVREYLLYGNIKNSVNFPDLYEPRGAGARLCIFHRCVENIGSEFHNILEESGVAVESSASAHKGDLAYTIINLDGDHDKLEGRLSELEGVIAVRRIQ
ncbi:MAG: 3-phosphoglycerate dehydrogenase family protein [Defluviitaleaceae bacterium]|nr:3-phosphoglycerate dehydrogenase family protein [Defluviitaleaceae bacterium]